MTKKASNSTIQPGDVVKLIGAVQCNGMLGEVVEVKPTGILAVRVAHIHIDMPTRSVVKDIRTFNVDPKDVAIDQEATAAVRSGRGGVIVR